MNWKRFTILIVSALCIGGAAKLVIACAEGDDPYDAPSFFMNTVNKSPAFMPFYYTSGMQFYDEGYGFDSKEYSGQLPDPVTASWAAYTHGEVTGGDIDSFVYRYSAKNVFNLFEHIRKGFTLKVPADMEQNRLTQWFIKQKDAEAVLYLKFAKECEPYARSLDAVWDDNKNEYEPGRRDSAAMQELVHEGIKEYNAARSPDIKLRYAYQVLRMAFYSRENSQTITLFNTLITARSNNFLYYRCVALKAGALYKMKKKDAAAYMYSLVFDNSDEIKKTVYTSFKWAVNSKIGPVLALCKNNHEKAVVYIMQGLYDYDNNTKLTITAMEKAYSLDPAVRGLDIVTTRVINKIENNQIANIVAGGAANDKQLSELNVFVQKVGKEGKAKDVAYWNLASAYIYLLQGSAANCKKYLDMAGSKKMTPDETDVYQVISTLYIVRKYDKVTPVTEQEMLSGLRQFEQRSTHERRYSNVMEQLMLAVLKTAYLNQGDTEKAVYCYSKSTSLSRNRNKENDYSYSEDYTEEGGQVLERMTPERLHAVEAFEQKKDKTPFETWLTGNAQYTADMLYELEGTKYLREYQFGKAADVLKKVPRQLLKSTTLPDVMISHLQDLSSWNKSDSAVPYDKLSFAEKMAELQQALAKDPKDGRAAYQYANGLYNMSYYGKAHHAYDYYHSCSDQNAYYFTNDRKKLPAYAQEFYGVGQAKRYYLQAYEYSSDTEVKARCLFMAAKCWQKNAPLLPSKSGESNYWDYDRKDYYNNAVRNPFFAHLYNMYRNTKFYGTASGTCSYLRDYARQHY